jgi:hypothetical protein
MTSKQECTIVTRRSKPAVSHTCSRIVETMAATSRSEKTRDRNTRKADFRSRAVDDGS